VINKYFKRINKDGKVRGYLNMEFSDIKYSDDFINENNDYVEICNEEYNEIKKFHINIKQSKNKGVKNLNKKSILLDNGKYEVIFDQTDDGKCEFHALRYGKEWRSLTGDNLVLCMFQRIQNLEERLKDNGFGVKPTNI